MMQPINFQPLWSHRWHPIAVAIVFIAMLSSILSSESKAHEFEDGFVERSVAVVVRDNVVHVEYSIGLNPSTKVQLINFWTSQDPSSVAITREGAVGEAQVQALPPSLASAKPQDFLQLAGENVGRRLRISVNDDVVVPRLISSLASSRHHVDVTVKLEFTLPQAKSSSATKIEIADGNFLPPASHQFRNAEKTRFVEEKTIEEHRSKELNLGNLDLQETRLTPAPFSGGFRYAIKAKGNAVLSRSNVASILIRSKRQLDEDFSEAERDDAYKIQAEVVNIE